MGRNPIGSKPMTPAERQRRRRQGIRSSTMTRGERTDLATLIRRREKLYKTAVEQRAAELMADFEKQISTIFKYDDDETWKAAYATATEAVEKARREVVQRCAELGIPPEFAPDISPPGWYGRGENAAASRRSELRRVAKTRIVALAAAAKTAIERASVDQQTTLISGGFTSDAAHAFLEQMPSAESLMPLLKVDQIEGLLDKDAR